MLKWKYISISKRQNKESTWLPNKHNASKNLQSKENPNEWCSISQNILTNGAKCISPKIQVTKSGAIRNRRTLKGMNSLIVCVVSKESIVILIFHWYMWYFEKKNTHSYDRSICVYVCAFHPSFDIVSLQLHCCPHHMLFVWARTEHMPLVQGR